MTVAADDFEFFRGWLWRRSAIALEAGKEYLVDARLEEVARAEGLPSVAALIGRLRAAAPPALETKVVEALTTNETSFFRDWKPFEALRTRILPDAIARRVGERRLDVWSAACASGQEAYSVAMLLADDFPQLDGWDVRIHGTDLSHEMVRRTAAGRFSQLEVNRGLPAPLLVRHFRQEPGGAWVVADALRRRVRASQLNLAGPWPSLPAMDVVLLRNVLIYFDVPTRTAILERVRRLRAPGGALFLGSAETTVGLHDGVRRELAGGAAWFCAA